MPDFDEWGRSLSHRGPDDAGVLVEEGGDRVCALGHARLAIIDLSPAGHQPMASADARYVIVFNGEIYNFRALRRELEAEGVRFRSHSDTEVLLEGIARHQIAFVTRLRGMFAFALWDRRDRSLLLVRDRLGVKPLYFARQEKGGVVFASEVRAVLASGLVDRRLDPEALQSFLANGSVSEPRTIAYGVEALPPGSWFEVSERGERRGQYYQLPLGGAVDRPDVELRSELRRALEESVKLRLEADVPVGVFLSGGIDSSVIATLAQRAASTRLHTLTVTFDEAE